MRYNSSYSVEISKNGEHCMDVVTIDLPELGSSVVGRVRIGL